MITMKNPNLLLVGSVVLILLAVALVAVLDKTSTSSSSTNDVRARAATKTALALTGVVASVDDTKGTLQVNNVQFTDSSRAGTAQNYGTWVVSAPAGFNFASVSPGTTITIGVDAATFQITKHSMNALTIVPAK